MAFDERLYKLGARVDALEKCHDEIKAKVEDQPSEADLAKLARFEAEAAFRLQGDWLPETIRAVLLQFDEEQREARALFMQKMIRTVLQDIDKEKAEARNTALAEIGYELGPDGRPRPQGGAFKAFMRKNATMILIFSAFALVSNTGSIMTWLRIAVEAWKFL